MYAIRSYYGKHLLDQARQFAELGDECFFLVGLETVSTGKSDGHRITSYNVCYTKLLRRIRSATADVGQVAVDVLVAGCRYAPQ